MSGSSKVKFIENTVCGETETAADWIDQSVWFRCLKPVRGRHVTMQKLSAYKQLTISELYVYVLNSGEGSPLIRFPQTLLE